MKNAISGTMKRAMAFFICCLALWVSVCVASENISGREMAARKNGSQGVDAKGNAQWIAVEPGLDFGEFRLDHADSKVTVLKIDPDKFEFVLCMSSADGKGARPLDAWAKENGLQAAINASMYLPGKGVSTGYMRSGEHVNNNRMVKGFGGFFVASPRECGLPSATIVEREAQDFPKVLDQYDIVIQNYRMTNSSRHILWLPGGPLYSISAVAQDGKGNILFIHSRMPVEAYTFVQQLLHLPLDIRTILYVEGGAQAGMLLQSEHIKRNLAGAHAPSFLVTGNLKARLPNVLGIRRKNENIENSEKPLQNLEN